MQTINEKFINTVKTGNNPQAYREYIDAGANVNFCKDLALRISVNKGRFSNTLALLALGANPNANQGEVLRVAIENDDTEIALILLESGARTEFFCGGFFAFKSNEMRVIFYKYREVQLN